MKTFNEHLQDVTNRSNPQRDWFTVRNESSEPAAEVSIFGPIGKTLYGDEQGVEANAFAMAFNSIPKGRPISMTVKSKGGNVWEGMHIVDTVRARRADVTCTVTGVAASIAAVICCAAGKVRMPKNAMMMTHPAQSYAEGDAKAMEAAASKLAAHDRAIASVIAEKTGRTQAQAEKFISEERWMTGDDAFKEGLCDEVTNEEPSVANEIKSFNFSQFRCVPESLRGSVNNKAEAAQAAGAMKETNMDRNKIVALLKQHGVEVSNDASDEQLLAALVAVGTKPKAAASAPQNMVDLENKVKDITDRLANARRQAVTNEVEKLIGECRIPANQKEVCIENALRDEKHLDFLRALEPKVPGAEPMNTASKIEVGASIAEISNAVDRFDLPWKAKMRGENVKMNELKNAAYSRANLLLKHDAQIKDVFNTAGDNTIATELKRNVILQTIVRDFARRVLPLNAFSTVFANVPLEGTDKVEVPYYDLDATASRSFSAATGYTIVGTTTTDKREIQVGMGATAGDRLFQDLAFTSQEIARQPYLNVQQLAALKAEKLAYDVVTDVLSVITAANYGAAAITSGADAFDSDDAADLVTACKLWPAEGRSLFVDTAYHVALLKDSSFKAAFANAVAVMKEGSLGPRVMGFDYVESPTIPSNSENLVGFAAHKSAILVATAPVPPIDEVRNSGTTYRMFVDPTTGIVLEYRTFGDNVLDRATHIIECNYGFAKGNYYQSASKLGAIRRITSA